VTADSDLNAGAALWDWIDSTGFEYINDWDYGRQIQTAYAYQPDPFTGLGLNPTEGGDNHGGSLSGFANTATLDLHGAPTVTAYNSGTTQITRSAPLEWKPSQLPGLHGGTTGQDGAWHPIVYRDMQFGKEVTLNYANMGPVAHYVAHAVVPTAVGNAGGVQSCGIEPTVNLVHSMANYGTYDPWTAQFTNVTPNVTTGLWAYNPPSGYGGVVAWTDDLQHAFGLYAGNVSNPVNAQFMMQNVAGSGAGHFDYPTSILSYQHCTLGAGDNAFSMYMMTGNVFQVLGDMQALAAVGTASRDLGARRTTPRLVPKVHGGRGWSGVVVGPHTPGARCGRVKWPRTGPVAPPRSLPVVCLLTHRRG
jgi:hypothetical protein